MSKAEVIAKMQTSTSFVEWYENKYYVMYHCVECRDFWYLSVVMSGIMWDILISFK